MAESNTFHGNSRHFSFLFFFSSGYQGTVHDGMKASGDRVADALVFALLWQETFTIVEARSTRNFPAEPVTGEAQYHTGDAYFCRGHLVGSRRAGTVVQAREVSDNMRDIPEGWHGRMGTARVGLSDV